ncbi:MAG: hypothetical protein QOD42_2116 [Sphingomonadales bacterium]|jgi:hypothetical protein|nr:hypothetical protein [Sphingomonadales bacterium]
MILDDVPAVDVMDFDEAPSLGRDLAALVVIKGFHQIEQNERYTRRLIEGGPLGRIDIREYRQGVAFAAILDEDFLSDGNFSRSEVCFFGLEPHWVDFAGDWMIIAFGDELLFYDCRSGETRRLKNAWFGQIHSAVVSPDRRHVLVTSTGFDSIVECEIQTGLVTWRWCAWEHGFDVAGEGHQIRLADHGAGGASPLVLVDGRPAVLTSGGRQFGLPMRLQTCHINHARYAGGDVLAVFFHQGAVFRIDRRTGAHIECLRGLRCPHGLFPANAAEYFISDTQSGRILFLDREFAPKRALGIANLPNIVAARSRATEWLQCTDLHEGGLLCAVDVHRSQIHILDVAARRRRSINAPRHWAMQRVVPVTPANPIRARLGRPEAPTGA